MSPVRFARLVCGSCALAALLASCAPKARVTLPSAPGTPFPDFTAVHAALTATCANVRTMTAEIGLSGQAGDEKLRGRIVAGFERPSSMRLEAAGPLLVGQIFELVARDGTATLVLTREARIVRNQPPDAILEAMTGVAMGPADLQAIFTGCVLPAPRATSGMLHANGWASIEIETSEPPRRAATLFLTRSGSQWQIRAARRDRWRIDYPSWAGMFPQSVEISAPDLRVDVKAALSQIEPNVDIDPAAFVVNERKNLMPLTLQELREAGPLRGQ